MQNRVEKKKTRREMAERSQAEINIEICFPKIWAPS